MKWINPKPMTKKSARVIIEFMCTSWWEDHPEDHGLPWQRVLFKVLKWNALMGGNVMFIYHSDDGLMISNFAILDRIGLPTLFNG